MIRPEVCQQIVLERLKYAARTHVDMDVLAQAVEPHVYIAHNADAVIIDLLAHLAGKNEVQVDESFPVDWWEAFKRRWFPNWLLKRYPVRMRHIKVDKATAFPTISIPNHSPVVIVTKMDRGYLYSGENE